MNGPILRNEEIIWRTIDDKIVLIGKDGLVIHVLNKTAARIWELCDGANGPDDITAALCERFDAPPEQIAADVAETLGSFAELGILREEETSGQA